jgi:hypothetical protein
MRLMPAIAISLFVLTGDIVTAGLSNILGTSPGHIYSMSEWVMCYQPNRGSVILAPLLENQATMLRAYFDDSGTHEGSKIVVVAGIMGTESELLSLELLSREILNDPVCGLRPAIAEFHAHDCFESKGGFQGWRRPETDFFRYQLRQSIIKSHVSAYGIAYFKEDWDDIIQGGLRNLFGNAEGNAVRNCFVRALKWAKANCFDRELSFIFDQSDDTARKRDVLAVYDAFRRHGEEIKLSGVSFLNSQKALHLQAADMFAWEFNRSAHKILGSGPVKSSC